MGNQLSAPIKQPEVEAKNASIAVSAAVSPRLPARPKAHRLAGNQAMQRLVQAKLAVNPPGDPYEQEADRVAALVLQGWGSTAGSPPTPAITPLAAGAATRCACGGIAGQAGECDACRRRRLALQGGELDASPAPQALARVEDVLTGDDGQPLPAPVRRQFESGFGRDFSEVRIHTQGKAAASADMLAAHAYTSDQDIVFASGAYEPETAVGRRLLAHELTHTVQQSQGGVTSRKTIQRQTATTPDAEDTFQTEQALADAVRQDDMSGVVAALRERSPGTIRYLIDSVQRETSIDLVRWVVERNGQTDAETALRLLWPAMSLLDRLEFYDEAFREIEAAQLDVIRAASMAERQAALSDRRRLDAVYGAMSPKEEYDARLLIQPDRRYEATVQLISRAEGFFSDEEDPVFDAILSLTPEERRRIWDNEETRLSSMLSERQLATVRLMTTGTEALIVGAGGRSTEAQALMARLRLATEGRSDDAAGVQTVVRRAAELLEERRQLQAQQSDPSLTAEARGQAEARLRELGDLDALLRIAPTGAAGRDETFMGRLEAAAGSSQEFGQFAQQLGADPFESAKRQILMAASWFQTDNEAIEAAVINLHAPPVVAEPGESDEARERRQTAANNELRRQLLDDREVRAVLDELDLQGPAGSINVGSIRALAHADRFDELLNQFGDAVNQANDGEIFRLALVFARRPDWKRRFQATADSPWNALAHVSGERRDIVDAILRTGEMPIDRLLTYASRYGTVGEVDILRTTLAQLSEAQRGRLRLGYILAREHPDEATLTQEAREALEAFDAFERQLRQSLSFGTVDESGVQDVLDAALGVAPTAAEMSSGAGRMRAAALLYRRQQDRLALRRGMVTPFTETDETMEAAAREFAALWERVRHGGELSATDFAALSALHKRFEGRAQEFSEANEMISEIASMVAATVAATIIVAATGGLATPGVLAAAAAAGAGTRLLTREMFGGDYFDPTSAEGAQTALLGAIDGALAVAGASLAARGVELVGLGGRALTAGAARLGAQATEQAGQSLGRRMAAGAVEAAIDGAFSGTISEAAATLTDAATWRRGVWQGLVSVGQSAILGGLTGLGTGALTGSALPVAGAGARRVRDAVLRNSVDRAVERAGAETVEALDAARRAARAGDQDEARRLLNQIEEHLTPEQARVLRAELSLDTPAGLRPPGAIEQPDAQQARLLQESGAVESGGNLTQEQLDNELAMVRRGRPQPTQEPGYIDEVDLGNGHRWRRREDGTWCRFTERSLCGTVIPGVAPHGATPNWQAALLDRNSPYYNPQAVERINRLLERVQALGIAVDMNELVEALAAFQGRGRRATRINEALDVIEAEFDRLARGEPGTPHTAEALREQGLIPSSDTGDAAQRMLEDAILGEGGGLGFSGGPVVLTGIGGEVQTLRSVLRDRMLNTGPSPSWAPTGREWNAHHVIPWQHQHHGVFNVLRSNGGWDHNIVANGIALPTRPGISGAEHLPVHQLPGPGRGHPIYNDYVRGRLNHLLGTYGDDPVRLRQEVMTLLEDLQGQLEAGGYRGYVF